MTSGNLKLKPGLAWFAAPFQWRTAIAQLSDGAFKLFVYICLNADRTTSKYAFRQTMLAQELKKSRRSVAAYLQELQIYKICSVQLSSNQHTAGVIQIEPPYWPYQYEADSSTSFSRELQSYVQTIQTYLSMRPCVRCRFSSPDRLLAEQWFHRGVQLWQIEQAILMGCGRKYVSWLDGADSQPIGSLKYFAQVLEEILGADVSPEYWDFNKWQVAKLEQKCMAAKVGSLHACANFSQAKLK